MPKYRVQVEANRSLDFIIEAESEEEAIEEGRSRMRDCLAIDDVNYRKESAELVEEGEQP